MKKSVNIFIFQVIVSSLFLNNILAAPAKYELYDEEDFEDITFGCKNMRRSDLRCAPLANRKFPDGLNLENSWLIGTSFRSSRLRNAILKKVCAVRASFREADLEGADLSYGNFTEALFWDANLNDVEVEGAVFYRAKGLKNEQKQYLRDHGALKVPLDIIYELEDYDKEVFDHSVLSFKEIIKRYFTKKYKWYFGSKNQGTQKFEEDFEDFPKDVSYPDENLSLKEKIKRFFYRKYELKFKRKHQETQTEDIVIQAD